MSTPTPTHTAVPNVQATAPERIYLVIGEDCPADADFGDLFDELTWCRHKIDDNSIPYVRADLASLPAVQGEQRSDIELCATLCDDLRAKAMSNGQDAAAGWLHQAASHMRGLDARTVSVASESYPSAQPNSQKQSSGDSVVPPVQPPGATLQPCAASQWVSVDERLPEPDSGEVLVWLTRNRCRFDEWATYREDPTGLGGPTMDMGVMWRDHEFEEVKYWARITPPTSQVERGESSSEGGQSC